MKPRINRWSVFSFHEMNNESESSEKTRYKSEGQGQRPKKPESKVQTGHDETQANTTRKLSIFGSFNCELTRISNPAERAIIKQDQMRSEKRLGVNIFSQSACTQFVTGPYWLNT